MLGETSNSLTIEPTDAEYVSGNYFKLEVNHGRLICKEEVEVVLTINPIPTVDAGNCLLYTSPSPRDA